MKKLTNQQKRFVEEYLIDLNAAQAARRAGYSATVADHQGSRILAYPAVAAAIANAQKERTERTHVWHRRGNKATACGIRRAAVSRRAQSEGDERRLCGRRKLMSKIDRK